MESFRMAGMWRTAMVKASAVAMVGLLPALTGCGSFFQCEGKASCGGSTGSSSTLDVVLVGDSSTGTEYINGYTLASGSLTALTNSPFLLDFVPTAMVVTPNNDYLYVASATGTIYSYTLSSTGVPSNGTAQATTTVAEASMVVSPNGDYLISVDSSEGTTPSLRSYLIGSDGVLTLESTLQLQGSDGNTITPSYAAVSPDGDYVAVSMGAAGDIVVPFDQSNGAFNSTDQLISTGSAAEGDNAIAWDSSDYLYIARSTGTIYVYSTATKSVSSTTYQTGVAPRSMVVADSSKYLYVGNETDGTISQFSISSGTLTSVSTTNFSAPTDVASLAVDESGKYLLAAGYNSASGLQVLTIGTGGALSLSSSVGTNSTSVTTPVAIPLAVTY
jgi:6-phosphogluconolactonase (cycloisomerase 2 family)